jgi:hypothetical protein
MVKSKHLTSLSESYRYDPPQGSARLTAPAAGPLRGQSLTADDADCVGVSMR